MPQRENNSSLYYIYDGECPLCKFAAQAYRVQSAVGTIILLNAREQQNHPIMIEVAKLNINLDESMAVKYGGKFYCGAEAMNLMALLSSRQNWFNRLNAMLFRHKWLAKLCYPIIRTIRNFLLFIRRKAQIGNLDL